MLLLHYHFFSQITHHVNTFLILSCLVSKMELKLFIPQLWGWNGVLCIKISLVHRYLTLAAKYLVHRHWENGSCFIILYCTFLYLICLFALCKIFPSLLQSPNLHISKPFLPLNIPKIHSLETSIDSPETGSPKFTWLFICMIVFLPYLFMCISLLPWVSFSWGQKLLSFIIVLSYPLSQCCAFRQ